VIRHPAYLGTFVAHAGLVLVFPSVGAAAALLLLWLPAVVLRAAVEDRFLLGHGEYATYARNVRYRLVPGVY
jgi:protein-S-isoprenylcysteine O-methyltransferase Ste14